ncbi:2-amino-4-hydroxy-6-hydroxymethyldihydropteridine diphosphokinase [Salisediminibacterium halotolerans]|uniref:2-amino-4-hydroxy-6- hydroxymethyldihydropteridine diphosphokinase n=1 Tax=Salisediminibacterium halotolerans TaxID=517425 RepID=UPI000EAD1746|nr:2-amino-4-hydroxy-6-hydroxymethyldihydropteridine diphosphokinase [Salisediminibacterium halotolerans]RLJ80931.1 2-amino-4-hydroxy-6-hydroxymethyldihydropteridine diphosphokinase [Actinophytocola xinjiangensis]RPE83664.1 2-amino-4-hydroxy-6-hydroxymethyldihydropteridine diphosphokinase [Salisediminibacterium halotolerans]TWG37856.1 2-amino-4-hydroxy-6-hydroxymethyldihydropteridine diphosphokinase [Salisediminibacterium halotolerans]GEL06988.1 2-amino-4-hydroxy-6-hydroxymethyldihydropteridine
MTDVTETVFYLALGSNQGDRESHLERALKQLHAAPGVRLVKVSSVYETAPVGKTDQPVFLNMAVKGCTALSPEELLDETQRIESEGGRMREELWGPRTIDLDILLFGTERKATNRLSIPHPRLSERAFVLIPLAEVEPDLTIDSLGSISELIERSADKDSVVKKSVLAWGEELRGN